LAKPLVIWRLTDGKPGHMQQTLGLANALARLTPCTIIDIDVSSRPVGWGDFLLRRFPPGAGLDKPDFILGAGHATHLALLAARRAAGGRAIALMKPSLPLRCFDVVVAPEHDGLAPGPRVINTVGVLNPMRPGAKVPGSLLFLIGGPSKHVQWDDATILRQLEGVLERLPAGTEWQLTDSRRTPDSLRRALMQRCGARFQSWHECQPGWLADHLAGVESVWVTVDSVSMVYEALTAGCRVGLLQVDLDSRSRIARGVSELERSGLLIGYGSWKESRRLRPAAHLQEAERVARLLLKNL
jgi:mitochondrial fission protein ELM1